MKRWSPGERAALSGAVLCSYAIGSVAGDNSAVALESALSRCAAIATADERLACYDALAAGLRSIVAHSPTAAPAQAPPIPGQEDFGLNAVQKQKAKPAPKQIESIRVSVTSIGTSTNGRMLVKLDNAQAWELDNADPLLAVGDPVTIERGALGSYLLTTPSRRTHHVRRIS